MQFVKVKIQDVKVKEAKNGFKGIYNGIYDALRNFTTEAFREGSAIEAYDAEETEVQGKPVPQFYKVYTVNRSITEAKNPIDSIEANIRAYMKREDWKPAIKYAVQFTDTTKTKIDIFARKMEVVDSPIETTEETETTPIAETTETPNDAPIETEEAL